MIWLESNTENGYQAGKRLSIDKPSPCVMAAGMGGDWLTQWRICNDHRPEKIPMRRNKKPPYRVPLMSEIVKTPWNGFTVASTFSGCGGSSTGYRMAGFKVLYANEFVPIAQESYAANQAPYTHLDGRDIRTVTAASILKLTGLKKGELDLFDGSPPCQAFSTAGKREKGWKTEKVYEHGASQCNEILFYDYIRLLEGLRPRMFIAENVAGLVKGTAKGMFIDFLKKMKEVGYDVACRVLDAKWLGVPQSRTRTIFMGVRNDLKLSPEYPKPLPYQYTVRDAIPWIQGPVTHSNGGFGDTECSLRPSPAITATQCRIRTGRPDDDDKASAEDTSIERFAIGEEYDKLKEGEQSSKYFSPIRADRNKPSPAILASHGNLGMAGVTHPVEKRKFTIDEVKRLCAFPDDFILKGTYAQQWERLGNSVPPVMMFHISSSARRILEAADSKRR